MRLVRKNPSPVFENTLLALLSGVLLTAAFPPGHLSFLSWVAVVPLLFSIQNSSWKSAFRLGFLAGLIHYLTLIYWIVVVLGRYGNLNIFFSVLGLLLLSLYLSLYLGVFSALAASVRHSRFELIFLPAFWVALEYLRTYLFSGFPWCLLGYTQYKVLPIIQVADLFGVYGISFFIILINTFLFTRLCRDKGHSRRPKWEMIVIISVTGSILTYGYHALSQHMAEEGARPGLKTAIVQANIDQSLKWDPAYQTETLRIL
ncbi:MAG: hypothetical protein U5R49_10540 [Deltaproteobacteria bacterium]|nr:hypothetical protein [Deltaproteobacteria bacterium]